MDTLITSTSDPSISFLSPSHSKQSSEFSLSSNSCFIIRNGHSSSVPISSNNLLGSSRRRPLMVEAKKGNQNKNNKVDSHSFAPNSDEAIGPFPEAVLLKQGHKEAREMNMNSFASSVLVVFSMMVVQVVFAGSQILTNLALKQEGFLPALLMYRHLIASACIAPIAIIFDREGMSDLKKPRVWIWAFLTSLCGITLGMGLFYYGVRDTTAAYATNYSNLIPIITFLFSVIIRTEALQISTLSGKLKVLGTVVCVGGAVIISFYEGPSLIIGRNSPHQKPLNPTHFLRGTLLLIASCFGYALWFVVQAKLLKVLPSKHWSNLLTCWVAALQCAVLGLIINRTGKSWALGWDVKLLCVCASGIFASALAFYLILWVVQLKDPSYPSMFDPFSVIFVALIQAVFFGDQLTVGLLVGMVVMIIGLYCYLWGKKREEKSAAKALPTISPTASPVATDPVDE